MICGGSEFDGFAVGGVTIGVLPSLLSREHCRRIGKAFRGHQMLERCEPVVVVMGAIIGFAARGGGFEFHGEGGCPFLPGEMALLGESYG